MPEDADRVVLSVRAPSVPADDPGADWVFADGDWTLSGLREDTYRNYLRTVHAGAVAVGEEFEEFVSRGCASPRDVVLRVEAVEGGDAIGPATALEVVSHRDVVETP